MDEIENLGVVFCGGDGGEFFCGVYFMVVIDVIGVDLVIEVGDFYGVMNEFV